jgi:hypothetical protein
MGAVIIGRPHGSLRSQQKLVRSQWKNGISPSHEKSIGGTRMTQLPPMMTFPATTNGNPVGFYHREGTFIDILYMEISK